MISRSNQQLKKKTITSNENKLPITLSEDIKDLFDHYDPEKLGLISYQQTKSILHYISGGIKRSALEKFISENSTKTHSFDLPDIEKLALKLWEDFGKEQSQKETNLILKTLGPYSENTELEKRLKEKLENK